jgi:DNA polymerase
VLDWNGFALVPTIHPSAILRMEPDDRDAALDAFVTDLETIAACGEEHRPDRHRT